MWLCFTWVRQSMRNDCLHGLLVHSVSSTPLLKRQENKGRQKCAHWESSARFSSLNSSSNFMYRYLLPKYFLHKFHLLRKTTLRALEMKTIQSSGEDVSCLNNLFIYSKRCAQAIKNKETWTGYLSLGFFLFFHCFVFLCLFHKLHVCYILCFLSLHVYFFVQIIHILPCKYSPYFFHQLFGN